MYLCFRKVLEQRLHQIMIKDVKGGTNKCFGVKICSYINFAEAGCSFTALGCSAAVAQCNM